ncbi:EamA family transporter [Sphingomonas aerolata]|uniref:EamA family transporter n=1 Tax=Sphingomonas aerolata TaxID=185951 RepID=UPI003360E584
MIADSMATARPAAWLVVLSQAYGNTQVGYGYGMAAHATSAATVTPLALLVPVFGMCSAAIILSEPLPAWKLVAAGLVLAGSVVKYRDRAGPARDNTKPFSARP